jgi:integrase
MALEQARESAAEYITAGWRGNDRVAEKRVRQAAQVRRETIELLVPSFHALRRAHLNGRSADQYESIWDRLILPEIGSTAINGLKRREVANLMDRVERAVGSSVADKIHEQLTLFFRWYAERDDDFTSPLVRTMKRHRKGTGARSMTDDELRQFWTACAEAGIAGAAGRLCLLTASRRNETTRATWAEISDDGIWTIPCNRYKTKREHIIPLSATAQGVVSELDTALPYLFSLTECAPDNWTLWRTIVHVGGPDGDRLSWHSLRKTARTLMSRAGVRSEHAERALGHVQGAVERAYDKHEYLAEKKTAFEALATEIERVVKVRPPEKRHATRWAAMA